VRKLVVMAIALVFLTLTLPSVSISKTSDWEALFNGNGDIVSSIYFKQNNAYFIDTDLGISLETFRYKRFFFAVDLFEETSMGRKYNSNMVFDPNRGHWSFGVSGRIELKKYFFEGQFHHDCFHDIGRWMQTDYSIYWNSPRVGFGSIGYLTKYKYHQPQPDKAGIIWSNKFDYYALASFFAPRGYSWQKHHDYDFTLNTNFRYVVARYKRLGLDIESNNLWVINSQHDLKRQHGLNFNFTVYGSHGAFMTYIGWWPYDSQSIRNRDGKTVFGFHFGF
jgi:hypothetical protein